MTEIIRLLVVAAFASAFLWLATGACCLFLYLKIKKQINQVLAVCAKMDENKYEPQLSEGEMAGAESRFKNKDGKLSYEKYREYQRRKNKEVRKREAAMPQADERAGNEIW